MRRVVVTAFAVAMTCAACSDSAGSASACDEARGAFDAHVAAASDAQVTARRLGGDVHLPITLAPLRVRNPGAAYQYEMALLAWKREARLAIAVVRGGGDCFSVEERAQAEVLAEEYE